MSQNNDIVIYLQKGKKITPIEALNKFGCFRLASRISDLRADGYKIHTDMVVTKSKKRIAQYSLK